MVNKIRLQKYIASTGIASRRKAEKLILDNRIKVNGKVVNELGVKIDVEKDTVMYMNKIIEPEKKDIYIMLNKPCGYLTTTKDEWGRKIVTELINGLDERIFPIGRLDKDTSGLLLLTNDGNLAHKIMHPSNQIYKRYIAKVRGTPTNENLEKFRNGLMIGNKITSKAMINIIWQNNKEALLDIKIYEGRNRQVRKMCKSIGCPVIELKRVAIGEINLNNLELGSWRKLTEDEVQYLKNI